MTSVAGGTCVVVSSISPIIFYLELNADYESNLWLCCHEANHWLPYQFSDMYWLSISHFSKLQCYVSIFWDRRCHFFPLQKIDMSPMERTTQYWPQYKMPHHFFMSILSCERQDFPPPLPMTLLYCRPSFSPPPAPSSISPDSAFPSQILPIVPVSERSVGAR